MKEEVNRELIGRLSSGTAGCDSATGEVVAASSLSQASEELQEELEQLRVRARERDAFRELLQRARADFENY